MKEDKILMESFNEIPDSNNWKIIKLIHKGWSDDKKYYIKTVEEKELLLRISDITQYENKKKEFKNLKLLTSTDILVSRPIDFRICNGGKLVYSLLTWVNGEDAQIILPQLDIEEQYYLGVKAGIYLKQIHGIPAPKDLPNWSERFNRKINIKISKYKDCPIKFKGAERMIEYIEDNRLLLEDRPQCFQHGDYHVGNMIITPEKQLGIIDFNRMDYGDPWEEFNRITFCVDASPLFASGYINGYFDDDVPDLFFRLMALYIVTNQIAAVHWAIPFGEEEVNIMLKQAENIMKWYDDFKTYIPSWYVANYV
mgnify:FL=1